ncbi:GroES-like protein [Myriangium duriaei CBS 260.36]|uniref:GroES-like protein n=1 Tax=Myriangium duriaei CBS 260.36 TaxID=1168546 RepID=A0A9P4IZ84_9PEZI|nr:GroES-like protein [Myriangium duriaei CBS 260.36]
MGLPTTMRALKVISAGKVEVQEVPLPTLRDDYILVRVHSIAVNPGDWKLIDYLSQPGTTAGCDLSGTVEAVGPKVTRRFSPGDRIMAMAHGVNTPLPEDGAFGEYAVVKGDIAALVPNNLSFEQAATLPIGVITLGLALYKNLGLPLPGHGDGKGQWLLVYGGSTASGSLAIQYGKLSGYRVISVNSPQHDGFVTLLGAEGTFDYHDKDIGTKIRAHTGNELRNALDCICTEESNRICSLALSSLPGGKVSYLTYQLPTAEREDIEMRWTMALTAKGEDVDIAGYIIPAMPEDFELTKRFWNISEALLAEEKIRPHPAEVRQGGLDNIFEGLDDLRQNRVSGKKLVYNVR